MFSVLKLQVKTSPIKESVNGVQAVGGEGLVVWSSASYYIKSARLLQSLHIRRCDVGVKSDELAQ